MSTGKNTGLLVAAGYLYRCILTLLCGYFLLVEQHGVEDGLGVTALGPKQTSKRGEKKTKARKVTPKVIKKTKKLAPPKKTKPTMLESLKAKMEELRKENARLTNLTKATEQETALVEKTLQGENEKLTREKIALDKGIGELREENARLAKATEQETAAVKSLQGENVKLTAEVNELSKKIKGQPTLNNQEEVKEPPTDPLKEKKEKLMAANESRGAGVQNLSKPNEDLSTRHEQYVELLSKYSGLRVELENKGNDVKHLKKKLGELQKMHADVLTRFAEDIASRIEANVGTIEPETLENWVNQARLYNSEKDAYITPSL